MKYNGVVHTQRAIKNLQKEVREILKQNQDQYLPIIDRRSSLVHYKETLLHLKNTRQISQMSSPEQNEPTSMNTISYASASRKTANKIKFKNKHANKIVLPRFTKIDDSAIIIKRSRQSMKSIESTLIDSHAQYQLFQDRQPQHYQSETQRKKSRSVPRGRIYRYNTKIKLNQLSENYTQPSSDSPVAQTVRQSCYSPWQRDNETDLTPNLNEYPIQVTIQFQ